MDHIPPETQQQTTSDASCVQCAEYLAGWKRCKADYENMLKENAHERKEFAQYANERLLVDLLPAIDQLNNFAMYVMEKSDSVPEPVIQSFKVVKGFFDSTLKQVGLEWIDDEKLDLSRQEIVGSEPSETVASGELKRTIQIGWTLHGKVIRPAKVLIAQ